MDKGGLFLLKVSYSDLGSIYFSVVQDIQIEEVYDYIKKNERIKEAVVLWTCNRFEIYFYPGDRETVSYIEDYVKGKVSKYTIIHGWDAIKNLFFVSAGLDSMVIGENEILGQVKDAWEKAKLNNLAGETVNPVFQKAIEVGKKVRRENGFNKIKRSVVSEALEIANLNGNEEVLVVGSGKTGALVAKTLKDRGIKFRITNRTKENAENLAKKLGIEVESYNKKRWMRYDVIITAISSHKAILTANDFINWKAAKVIDLGVPPNVQADKDSAIQIINMDMISKKIENEKNKRIELANRAFLTVEEEFNKFSQKIKNVEKENLLRKINEYSDIILKIEMEEMEKRINFTPEERVTFEKGLIATRNRLLGFIINAIKKTDDIKSSGVVKNMEVIMDENFSRFKTQKTQSIARD